MIPKALVIDDEADLCRLMQITLKKMGIDTDIAYDLATANDYLAKQTYDFCLTDLRLPDGSGLDLVKSFSQNNNATPIAVITAHGSMDLAIKALKYGAFDFVNKPLELPRLRQLVEHALRVSEESKDNDANLLTKSPTQLLLDERLIGTSVAMQKLKATIVKLARSQAPVFLWGASGTGKEVVANLIHDLSSRREGSFVPVNCGAIPSELMESEFFGHKKGSFTGATTDKIGLFQQADGGTLFLDEVADLPLPMQVKLLRAIQEKTVRAIGDTKEVAVDIRILSATHKNLAQLVQQGVFRQDLFYRINVIELKLPTLNEREEDVFQLATYFLAQIASEWQLEEPITLSDEAKFALKQHDYEGNVRELRNLLERAVTLTETNVIEVEHLGIKNHSMTIADSSAETLPEILEHPSQLSHTSNHNSVPTKNATSDNHDTNSNLTQIVSNVPSALITPSIGHNIEQTSDLSSDNNSSSFSNNHYQKTHTTAQITTSFSHYSQNHNNTFGAGESVANHIPEEGLEAFLQEQERQLIICALNQTNWNKTNAAKLLQTSFRSLRYRMKKLGIDNHDEE